MLLLLQATAATSATDAFSVYGVLGVPASVSIVLGALTTSFWLGVKAYTELTGRQTERSEQPRRFEDAEIRLERRELVDAVVLAHEKAFDSLRREITLTREVFTDGIEKFVEMNDRRHAEVIDSIRRVETQAMKRGAI